MHSRLVAIISGCMLVVGTTGAQTLEENFAALCGNGQQSETCDVLRTALAKRLKVAPAAAPATASHSDPVWGPLAKLAGTTWAIQRDGFAIVSRFDWDEPGKVLRYKGGMVGLPQDEMVFRPGREPGTLIADIHSMGDRFRNVLFRFDGQGVLVSDWYRRYSTLGMGGLSMRHEFRLTRDGRYESRDAVGEGRARPDFPPLHGNFRLVSEQTLATMSSESRERVAEINRQVERERREQERREEAERDARWSQAMGTLNGALDAGLEVARAQEAQSRYELDATLADTQARQAQQMHATTGPVRGTPPGAGQGGASNSLASAGGAAGAGRESPQAGTDAPGSAIAAAKSLRFVLMIGMRNLPGDRNNSVCYSNVITRPGPPGWGARGFLPSGSAEQALQQIRSMKDGFIAACRRKGREITGEGNFTHRWNQTERDEQDVQATGPRVPEDLSVVLN